MDTPRYYPGCAACAALWDEYSAVTREHFRLENKLELASLEHDDRTAVELRPLVLTVSRSRSELRERMARHLEDVHPVGDAAARH